ncbi:AraC family transcriptional regulator [Mesorhizobium sp. CO1-1-8]|uniref:AraC family transcriptional regulator n=1 Tax=Mesorhizobium sp. CO1-1-8 TaxID=2876631 RepID=UPI001CD0CA4A|nr:AraC family transcriptional regulator [Mesorhizobium sp. CO1-1-8]MBZ9772628.1 AraC family transcriptional regulator [Mesorhizobium sp. CO1-1-8]
MSDPLTQIVGLLQPNTSFSKVVIAAGVWAVRRLDDGLPFYCAVLEGSCRLSIAGREPIRLRSGDFVLVPAAYDFVTSSVVPPPAGIEPQIVEMSSGVYRLGSCGDSPDVRMLVGHCAFGSDDANLLVSLLPQLVHVRGERRLMTLVELVNDETRADRPGRDVVLARLLEVLLIEALRSTTGPASPPGLLRGLSDDRLAAALREMHERPAQRWTVVDLAKKAALSRSTFFERFRREVGVAPMEYLLGWRMALAKDLLRRERIGVARVAERVGYGSASAFSVAFSRYVGTPPIYYARAMSLGHVKKQGQSGSVFPARSTFGQDGALKK